IDLPGFGDTRCADMQNILCWDRIKSHRTGGFTECQDANGGVGEHPCCVNHGKPVIIDAWRRRMIRIAKALSQSVVINASGGAVVSDNRDAVINSSHIVYRSKLQPITGALKGEKTLTESRSDRPF